MPWYHEKKVSVLFDTGQTPFCMLCLRGSASSRTTLALGDDRIGEEDRVLEVLILFFEDRREHTFVDLLVDPSSTPKLAPYGHFGRRTLGAEIDDVEVDDMATVVVIGVVTKQKLGVMPFRQTFFETIQGGLTIFAGSDERREREIIVSALLTIGTRVWREPHLLASYDGYAYLLATFDTCGDRRAGSSSCTSEDAQCVRRPYRYDEEGREHSIHPCMA